MGIAVVNFGAAWGGQVLEEGRGRLETALRMARADAANQGRRFRLAFQETDGRVLVLWEPRPLEEPGVFVDYAACTWKMYLESEGWRIERWDVLGPTIYRMEDLGAASRSKEAAPALTFEPDGSSDSAVIEVVAADGLDPRLARLELDGLTGVITSRILSTEELQAE